jgi:hypothetical protein
VSETLKCPNCGLELPEFVVADEATETMCPYCKQVVKPEPTLDPETLALDPETPTFPKLRVIRVTSPVYHAEPEGASVPAPEPAVDAETPQVSTEESMLVSRPEDWPTVVEPPVTALPQEQAPVAVELEPLVIQSEDWPTVVEPPSMTRPGQWPIPAAESPRVAEPEDWPTAPLEAAPPAPVPSLHLLPPTAAPTGDVGATRPISPPGWVGEDVHRPTPDAYMGPTAPFPPAPVKVLPPAPMPVAPAPMPVAPARKHRTLQIMIGALLVIAVAVGAIGYFSQRGPVIYQSSLKGSLTDWENGADCASKADGYHIMNGSICYAPIGSEKDADIKVTVVQLSGATDLFYGIVIRSTPEQHYYLFGIDGYGRWLFVNVHSPTQPPIALIAPTLDNAVNSGLHQTNSLELRMKGASFQFFINGKKVGEIKNPQYAAGQIGLSGEDGVEVVYTNLSIIKVN